MEIRITFRCEIYITEENAQKAVDKFYNMDDMDIRNNLDIIEIESVEDAKTHKDYTEKIKL